MEKEETIDYDPYAFIDRMTEDQLEELYRDIGMIDDCVPPY